MLEHRPYPEETMDDPNRLPQQRQLFERTPEEQARLLAPDCREHCRALLSQLLQAALQTEAAERKSYE
jgi:hypothetical protein